MLRLKEGGPFRAVGNWLRGLDLFKNVPDGNLDESSEIGCGDQQTALFAP